MLVTASHHRHFRNYNHVNALVIPFEWRKEWLIARWTLGGGLGGQLLIRTGARGHSFAEEGSGDAELVDALRLMMPTCRTLGSPGLPLHGYTWDFNSNPNGGWTLR